MAGDMVRDGGAVAAAGQQITRLRAAALLLQRSYAGRIAAARTPAEKTALKAEIANRIRQMAVDGTPSAPLAGPSIANDVGGG